MTLIGSFKSPSASDAGSKLALDARSHIFCTTLLMEGPGGRLV